MPTYQTQGDISAYIKRELSASRGTAAVDGAGAHEMRVIESDGLEKDNAEIRSEERRASGFVAAGRLGGITAGGGFNHELSVGGAFDLMYEAAMRGVWRAALTITEATGAAGALTVNATNQITRTGGSWITDGVREGDVGFLANYSTAADNNINLRVTSVSALVLTFAGTPLVVGASDAAWSFTILKKLVEPTAPTRYSHTIEQRETLIDRSQLFVGCQLIGLGLEFRPGQMAKVKSTWMAMNGTPLETAASPYFTTPVLTTGVALVADDSAIRRNGVEIATFNSMDINFELGGEGFPVIGSYVTPDIFDGLVRVRGRISGLRSDFSSLTLRDAETEFQLGIMLQEPGTTSRGAVAFHMNAVKLAKVMAPLGGGSATGAKVETYDFMCNPRVAASGIDGGTIQIYSTAA